MALPRPARLALLCCSLVLSVVAYDEVLALQLAYLEKAVYCGKDNFDSWQVGGDKYHGPRADASKVHFATDTKTEAAAGIARLVEPAGCAVAFRGTMGLASALLDLDFAPPVDFERKSCPGCRVDPGFKKNYESIRADIFDTLKKFDCEDQPLYLTGHSLGAASLHFLLYDALELGYNVTHMYAMESPRPGNQAFADAIRKVVKAVDAWRITHNRDLVPHLPPGPGFPRFWAYVHPLKEVYYGQENGAAFKKCPADPLDGKTCSSEHRLPWQWNFDLSEHCWFKDINPCACPHSETVSTHNASTLVVV